MKYNSMKTLMTAAVLGLGATQALADPKPLSSYQEGDTAVLTGTVIGIDGDDFTLDFGGDTIEVELEGWTWGADVSQYLKAGDEVVVSGTVEDGWFDNREIEANNIYLTATRDYYYVVDTSPAYVGAVEADVNRQGSTQGQDQQQVQNQQQGQNQNQDLTEGTYISTRGEVTKVSGREFTVESDGKTLTIDTAEMMYNPLDKAYGEPIEQGDRVYVYGEVDDEFFSKKEISANSVVKLRDASEQS
ncbi:hypothetical protein [Allohahella sp. A8]|uniref:hypothetical protein n=1 Tax=Allohahella sp. A8 TaxID=3141461 RepID=UPI003A7FE5F2